MPVPPYEEVPTVSRVLSAEQLDPVSYLAANPDVRAAQLDPMYHFSHYGLAEGRFQIANLEKIRSLRAAKLKAVRFGPEVVTTADTGEPIDYLSPEIKNELDIPELPLLVGTDYNNEIISLIRSNPDKLFLDVGAGLRHTYHSNVVNFGIWDSASTDVIGIAETLPFTGSQFDFVLCLATLEHTRRPWIAVSEIIRVTRPDGMIHVDWPFLRPVHGYPHHYFNATPKGTQSQFEQDCEILSCDVRPWQHPIFALHWMLQQWIEGLPQKSKVDFTRVTIGDLLSKSPGAELALPFCKDLNLGVQRAIAAGTTLVARKRPNIIREAWPTPRYMQIPFWYGQS